MEVWGLIGFLFLAVALTSMALGVVAFVQTRELKAELRALKLQLGPQAPVAAPQPKPQPETKAKPGIATDLPDSTELRLELDLDPAAKPASPSVPPQPFSSAPSWQSQLFESLRNHWMVWLGGACVALAGIFLARYAAEQGILGPGARVAGGLLTGFGLHALAFWLRMGRGAHPSFAALAGGASITLFAVLLAALHWYQLFSVPVVFIALALVALATLWLALLHGPVLAAIGMLGAYSVPALVSSGTGAIHVALIYSLAILVSVLALYRRVARNWLWWGALAGPVFWWLVSQDYALADGWRGGFLALVFVAFVLIGSPGWRLAEPNYWPGAQWRKQKLALTAALLLLLAAINTLANGWYGQFINSSVLPLLVLLIACVRRDWGRLACLALLVCLLPMLAAHGNWAHEQWRLETLSGALAQDFYLHMALTITLLSALNGAALFRYTDCHWRAAQALLTPLAGLCIWYLVSPDFLMRWQWALAALAIAGIYLACAPLQLARDGRRVLAVWLFIAGHFALGLGAALALADGGLTLALTAMMLSVAAIIHRLGLAELGWVFKALVVLITLRLSANPFVVLYPASAEWLLLGFAASVGACTLAARWLQNHASLARWSEAAALHLAMLTLWLLARYLLNAGDPFSSEFSAAECVTNLWLLGAMACIYEYKARLSESLSVWYRVYSRIQAGLAGLHYLMLVAAALDSAPWLVEAIHSRPLVNLLLPALIAPLGFLLLAKRLRVLPQGRWPLLLTMGSLFLLLNFEIHHLWQGTVSLQVPVSNGELYSYSAAWLLIAMALMLSSHWHQRQHLYRSGMGLLLLVIAKIFLWDMAGLEGLLRVASFMGLGLALLAMGYLHQRLTKRI